MTRPKADQPLVPSLLDRLLDDAPELATEPARDRTQRLADLKRSVRRDVEELLNTRRRPLPGGFPEVAASVLAYGLPDFSGAGPATGKEREGFARQIEGILRTFDRRLSNVRVELKPTDDGSRTLRFHITALLAADPAPEPVEFDSTLEPATGTFAVAEGAE